MYVLLYSKCELNLWRTNPESLFANRHKYNHSSLIVGDVKPFSDDDATEIAELREN